MVESCPIAKWYIIRLPFEYQTTIWKPEFWISCKKECIKKLIFIFQYIVGEDGAGLDPPARVNQMPRAPRLMTPPKKGPVRMPKDTVNHLYLFPDFESFIHIDGQ